MDPPRSQAPGWTGRVLALAVQPTSAGQQQKSGPGGPL